MCDRMKNKKSKNKEENPLDELDKIKLKDFKQLEEKDLKDCNLDYFKKSRLNEFKEYELKYFKDYVEDSKIDRNIENLKLELKSNEACKNILNELESIGINGSKHLELLKKIKKGYV